MGTEDPIEALRAALAASPDNVPLRRHLADVLLQHGRMPEAEVELKEVLRRRPRDPAAMLALARSYRLSGKHSAAHVILEEMIRADVDVARARVERVRVLLAEGDSGRAALEYRRALDDDLEVADAELGERLGVVAGTTQAWSEVVGGREREAEGPGSGPDDLQPELADVDFSDVGGMEELKRDIRRKIIHPLQHPEMYQAYGKKAGGGILLYGPPGCGKTHIARATAGEIEARFLAVGIHDVLDMWIGQSERNLHGVFEVARAHRPCVLFFDEADALGASRSDMRTSAGRQTINQFLAELDGVRDDNEGVLVLAATNAPWQMDAAFRRPGRFDRVVFVAPPDANARAEILRILLRDVPQRNVDLEAVAKRTNGFSGADLRGVVEAAVEVVIERAVEAGAPVPLGTKDLTAAAKRRNATTREWFRTARNYVLYANDNGIYDDIKPYLNL